MDNMYEVHLRCGLNLIHNQRLKLKIQGLFSDDKT